MTRFEAILDQRRQYRLQAATSAWKRIHSALTRTGIDHRLFGSLEKGDFREHSDIDLMILGNLSPDCRQKARKIAEEAAAEAEIGLDLFFEQDLSESTVEAILEH